MKLLKIQQEPQSGLFQQLSASFPEGQFLITLSLLTVGIIVIFFFVKGIYFIRKRNPQIIKMINLINSRGLIALALGERVLKGVRL